MTAGGRWRGSRAHPVAIQKRTPAASEPGPWSPPGSPVGYWSPNWADSLTLSGSDVTAAADLTTNGNDLAPSSTAPVLGTINGVAAFDMTGNGAQAVNLSHSGAFNPTITDGLPTIYMVVSLVDGAGGDTEKVCYIQDNFGAACSLDYIETDAGLPQDALFQLSGGVGASPDDGPTTPGGAYLVRWQMLGSGSGEVYVGGVGTEAVGHTLNGSGHPVNLFAFGSRSSGAPMKGLVGEVLLYDGSVSGGDDTTIRTHLADTYGVTA